MTAERCRYENHQITEREQQRLERHRRECSERPWYDPRRWFCTIVTFFETIWVTVTRTVRTLVCTAVAIAEEAVRVVGSIIQGAITGLDGFVGTVTGRNDTGLWPIVNTVRRRVPSVPRLRASSRSMALGIDPARLPFLDAYREEGVPVDVELRGQQIFLRHGDNDWTPLAPRPADYPPFANQNIIASRATSVTYDVSRTGQWGNPGTFDMIAAGGDRLMAKVAGTDDIYLLILANPFVHMPAGGPPISLPQSFFKLDPRVGDANADRQERILHLRVPGDDETHLATERFPLMRWLFGDGTDASRPSVDLMAVWFAPNIWTKVDSRPRRDTAPPPRGYPAYDHVVYRANLPLGRNFSRDVAKQSVRYERVLDLGIGSSHLHEQHIQTFGGEVDALSGDGGFSGRMTAIPRRLLFGDAAFDAAYRFANGPIEDYAGWVDGTCIYYMLVQLKGDGAIAAGGFRNAFAVLWADEQFAFTERWRLLHIYERDFTSPFQPIVGKIAGLADEYYPGHPFDGDRYFCPFQEGHIRPWSRMAVSRQHVVVSGIDPETGLAELYSIHWAWGSMDKTWRRRILPALAMPPAATDTYQPHVDLSTLTVRWDATIMVHGKKLVEGKLMEGRWTQRVLPSSGQEEPSIAALAGERPFSPRRRPYRHPWRFVAEESAQHLDRDWSHYGVLEAVDSRVQCYLIGALDMQGLSVAEIEAGIWRDADNSLRIDHQRVDYTQLAAALELADGDLDQWSELLVDTLSGNLESLPAPVPRLTQASRYHANVLFRLRFIQGVGWIAMWADKRDDKTIALTIPKVSPVRLIARNNPGVAIVASEIVHVRSPRDAHGADIGLEPDGISPPAISRARISVELAANGLVDQVIIELHFARNAYDRRHPALNDFETWAALNVAHMRVAATFNGQTRNVLSVDRTAQIANGGNPANVQRFSWRPSVGDNNPELVNLLSAYSSVVNGTSLWCVGATGLAAAPDLVEWA